MNIMNIVANVYKAAEFVKKHPIGLLVGALATGAAVFGAIEGPAIVDMFQNHTASAPDGPMWDPGVINK